MGRLFNLEGNYKAKFRTEVDRLIELDIDYRPERQEAVEALIDSYVEAIGERPPSNQVARLTDYVIHEELYDPDPHKMSKNEYPILSERQFERRKYGERGARTSNMLGECTLGSAEFVATDGRDYRYPSRRMRTIDEMIYVDEHAKIRNKERAEQYQKEITPSEAVCTKHSVSEVEEYLRRTYAHLSHLPWFKNLVQVNDVSNITYEKPPWWD